MKNVCFLNKYTSTTKQAALVFMLKHEMRYRLSESSGSIYQACLDYMTSEMKVPLEVAEPRVKEALNELGVLRRRRSIKVEWCDDTETHAYLVDRETRARHPIAIRLLPSNFILGRKVKSRNIPCTAS